MLPGVHNLHSIMYKKFKKKVQVQDKIFNVSKLINKQRWEDVLIICVDLCGFEDCQHIHYYTNSLWLDYVLIPCFMY